MKSIHSRENGFFKQLKRLAQSGRARSLAGQTILDGVHLVAAYESFVGPVETLIVSESVHKQPEIEALLQGRDTVILADPLFREAAVVDAPSGLMALVAIPESADIDLHSDTVVLDGVQDPGNVGTMMRTAAAAGFRQFILSADCAAPWAPRVLRAGQGAHFSLKIVQMGDLGQFLSGFLGPVAVTHLQASTSLYEAPLSSPMAWVFGSEGQGVRPETVEAASLRIKIPMAAATESLNVAAAAAVCLFETRRRLSAV